MNHLERHNILSDHQHGFRKRRSCETQLIQAVEDLAKCLNEGGQIDAVLLDFSEAFDKVSHHHLATKLHHYGMRGKMLEWVKSFLSSPTQEVILKGKKSSLAPVTSGVPQGSVPTSALTAAPTRTRGNTHRYFQPFTRIEAYKHSFFPSTIKSWNKCTQQLVSNHSIHLEGFCSQCLHKDIFMV